MPRRTLDSKTSWDDIYNYLSHVEIALSLAVDDGDKDLVPLVAPVKKLLDKWAKLDGDRRDRQRAVIRAHALVGLRDLGLDDVTTQLHHDVLGVAKQSRKAPLFQQLFPKALSAVVSLSLEAQLGVSRTLLHKLTLAETPAALRKAHDHNRRKGIDRRGSIARHPINQRAQARAQDQPTKNVSRLVSQMRHFPFGRGFESFIVPQVGEVTVGNAFGKAYFQGFSLLAPARVYFFSVADPHRFRFASHKTVIHVGLAAQQHTVGRDDFSVANQDDVAGNKAVDRHHVFLRSFLTSGRDGEIRFVIALKGQAVPGNLLEPTPDQHQKHQTRKRIQITASGMAQYFPGTSEIKHQHTQRQRYIHIHRAGAKPLPRGSDKIARAEQQHRRGKEQTKITKYT